jgi:hypothetical protein
MNTTDPTITTLPGWQADRLAVLLDTLAEVPISDAERRSLAWVCGFERDTVENLAAVITRARSAGPRPGTCTSTQAPGAGRGVAARGRPARRALGAPTP